MLIIFDLFGVILTKGLQSSIHKLTDVFGKSPKIIAKVYRKWEILFDSGKIDEFTFWNEINRELGTNVKGEILSNIILSSYKLKEETIMLIKFLKDNYPIVLYSNYRKGWYDLLDKKHQISSLFDKVFISSETKLLKPDKKAFELVLNHFNVLPKDVILIDDEVPNINSFNLLGGHGVLFNNIYETEVKIRDICSNKASVYNDYYSGIILRTSDNTLILQRRDLNVNIENSGRLSVFGGRREGTESPICCALRELLEETSIKANEDDLKLIYTCSYPRNIHFWILCHYYLLDNVDLNLIDLKEGQNIEVWKPANALKQNDLTQIPRIVIEQFFSKF